MSLNSLLGFLKVEGVLYSMANLKGDWGAELPSEEGLSMFHILLKGKCEIAFGKKEQILEAGDIVFLPFGGGHKIRSDKKSKTPPMESFSTKKISPLYETLNHGKTGPQTVVLCGLVKISHPSWEILKNSLPRFLYLSKQNSQMGDWIQLTVEMIAREASAGGAGSEVIVTRLVDVLLIRCIRFWVESLSPKKSGLLLALKDPKINQAINLIHKDPSKPWTLKTMAEAIGMSRTSFHLQFVKIMGESFGSYLVLWRMQLALFRLQEGERMDLDFVESLGYSSESSFRRAFKACLGMTVTEAMYSNIIHSG